MKQLAAPGVVRILRDPSKRFRSDPPRPFLPNLLANGVTSIFLPDWYYFIAAELADGSQHMWLYGDGTLETADYYFRQVNIGPWERLPPLLGGVWFNYTIWDKWVMKLPWP